MTQFYNRASEKVVKLYDEQYDNQRFKALEPQINELKSLLLLNEGGSFHKNKKEYESEWARPDSNRRPPPCEGSLTKLEPLLCLSNNDCQLVRNDRERTDEPSSEELGASFRRFNDEMRVFSEVLRPHPEHSGESTPRDGLVSLELSFSCDELASYTKYRKTELTRKSADWIERASRAFWLSTNGRISRKNLDDLREFTFAKYTSQDSVGKVLAFARAFLLYLTKTRLDVRYRAFEIFLEQSRCVKKRKHVTNRIVTKEDIEHVLSYIKQAEQGDKISGARARQYMAFTIFGAFTGQRSMATMMKLTVGQFREALAADKPVILIECSQDKIRMEHYVPLHPQVVDALKPLVDGRSDDELMFQHGSFWMWIKRQKISMSRFNGHFVLGDLRKFCDQHGDILCWNESNRAYILTHGVSGIQWAHYKRPLPEHVYDVYIQHWGDVHVRI